MITDKLDAFFTKSKDAFEELSKEINHSKPEELFCTGALIKKQLELFTAVSINQPEKAQTKTNITYNVHPQPSFNKQFDLLIKNLNNKFKKRQYINII